jgi:hypothetical protein
MTGIESVAGRKAILVAQAEVDRANLARAAHELRAFVSIPRDEGGAIQSRPFASRLLSLAVPAMGFARTQRWVRLLSIGIAAYRFFRGLRRRRLFG